MGRRSFRNGGRTECRPGTPALCSTRGSDQKILRGFRGLVHFHPESVRETTIAARIFPLAARCYRLAVRIYPLAALSSTSTNASRSLGSL